MVNCVKGWDIDVEKQYIWNLKKSIKMVSKFWVIGIFYINFLNYLDILLNKKFSIKSSDDEKVLKTFWFF